MAERLTVFQEIKRQLSAWDGTGAPPARTVYHDNLNGISGYVDPYRKLPGTVVVVPHEATPGKAAYFHELAPSRRAKIGLVTQAIGSRMLEVTGLRPIEHIEGYGVSDHAHTVLYPAARGAGRALYEQVALPDPEVLAAELDATQRDFSINGANLTVLVRRLEVIDSIAPLLDSQQPPLGVAEGLSALTDRVTLST